ncbi:MAG: FG-GAP-like repeat-containing protein [Bacteroidota bacterium]
MKQFLLLGIFTFSISLGIAQGPGWFDIITPNVGLEDVRALRVNVVDLNNDDFPDLVVGQATYRRDNLRVFLNVPDTTGNSPGGRWFEDITEYSGINSNPFMANTGRKTELVTFADVNNDGNVDVLTGTWHWNPANSPFQQDRSTVMLGDGTGRFQHITNNGLDGLGFISISGFSYLDYDQDGNLDVFVSTFSQNHQQNAFRQDYLLQGQGNGIFRDVTSFGDIGQEAWPNYGSTVADWNNDGFPDIMTSPYCRSTGAFYQGNGRFSYRNIADDIGYSSQKLGGDVGQQDPNMPPAPIPLCQWGAYPYDYDNDGDVDVLQVLVHGGLDPGEGRTVIAKNMGPTANPPYKLEWDLDLIQRKNPQSEHLGNMDAAWMDIDNDMWTDLIVTETVYRDATDRLFVFLQDSSHVLNDITAGLNLLSVRSPHSLETIDYDMDGDYDLVVGVKDFNSSGAYKLMFIENKVGRFKRWVQVKLKAPAGVNSNCIGAKIHIVAEGVHQQREIQAGVGHFGGQNSFIQNFGLQFAPQIDSLWVEWPSQNIAPTVLTDLATRQLYVITDTGIVDPNVTTSVVDAQANSLIRLYPNPAQDKIFLQYEGAGLEHITLLDPVGKVIRRFNPRATELSLAGLPSGMYMLRVQEKKGVITRKIVKE